MTIGSRLFKLRKEREVGQKELAALLKCSMGTVSNYENNVHFPDVIALKKLAKFYNVSTDYILGLTNFALSLDRLNEKCIVDYSAGEFLDSVLELSENGKRGMKEYLELMSMRDKVYRAMEEKKNKS